MQKWRFGLLLFLFSHLAFAVEPIDLTFAVPVIGVCVGIFLALSSMLATAIADARLQAWVKTEIREFIAGILLITIVVTFFISSNSIVDAITGKEDFIGVSEEIIEGWLTNYDQTFEKLITAATRIRAAATYSPYMNIPMWYVSFSYSTAPISGVGMLLGSLNIAAQSLTNVVFMAEGLRLLLYFIKITAPTVLLPLSFAIRLLPFTRRLGNTLISLSIAGLLFLPFSVILADELNNNINYPTPTLNPNKLNANPWAMVLMEPLCQAIPIRTLLLSTDVGFAAAVCAFAGPFFGVCFPYVKEVVYPLIMNIFQLVIAGLLAIWEAFYAGILGREYAKNVFDELYPFLASVNNLVLISYLNFILVAIFTIVGARSLSAALGGEWYMAGIQRLI